MSKLAQTVQRLVDELRKGHATPSTHAPSEAAVIKAVRAKVFRLDPACICGACRRNIRTDQMHEIVPRSKTRGLAPEVRFSTANCVRLSAACHAKVTGEPGHGKRLTIACDDPARGADGPVRLTWKDGRTHVYQRHVATVAGGAEAAAGRAGPRPLLDRPGHGLSTGASGRRADARGVARG